MIYAVTFEQRSSEANYGKVVLTATREVADDATVNVYVDLVSPSGVSINTKDFSVPDLVVTAAGELTWDIPTDSNGDALRGTFTLRVYVEQTTTTPGVQSLDDSQTYYFKAYSNLSALRWDEVCVPGVVGVLTLVDDGDYSALTQISRTLKVQYPPQEGLADLTGTGTSLQITPKWTGVDYIGSVTGEYSVTEDDGDVVWTEYYSFTSQLTKTFDCSTCEITECIQAYTTKIAAKPSLSAADNQLIAKLSVYEMAYTNARSCGNNADAAVWAEKIQSLLGCDCGCDEVDGPQPFATALFDSLVAAAAENETGVTDWTLITPGETFAGGWDTVTNATPQLQWRQIGNRHIELMGTVGKSGLTGGSAEVVLLGYFEALGITLKSFYGLPVTLTENNGSVGMLYGGALTVQYSGTSDNIAIHTVLDAIVPLAGTARYFIHALIPIEN